MNFSTAYVSNKNSFYTQGQVNSTDSKQEATHSAAAKTSPLETISQLAINDDGNTDPLKKAVASYISEDSSSSDSISNARNRKNELLDLALEFHLDGKTKATFNLGTSINDAGSSKTTIDIGLETDLYTSPPNGSQFRKKMAEKQFSTFVKGAADGGSNKHAEGGRKVAQFVVGLWHLEGRSGFGKNQKEALVYLERSAEKGYKPAIELAEHCDKFGPEKALLLYKHEKGDRNATFQLGKLALKEQKPDNQTAITYFTTAKQNGHADASFELAEIYATQYKLCTSNLSLRDKAIKNYEEAAKGTGDSAGMEGKAAKNLLEFKVKHCEDSYGNAKVQLDTYLIGKTRIIGNEVPEKTTIEQKAKAGVEAKPKEKTEAKLTAEVRKQEQAKLAKDAKERKWEEEQNSRLEAQFLNKAPKAKVIIYDAHEEL